MADKRIYQLSTATTTSGKYIIIDKSGQANAEKYDLGSLISAVENSDVAANTNWASGYRVQFGDGTEMEFYYTDKGYIDVDSLEITGVVTIGSDVHLGYNGSDYVYDSYAKTQDAGDSTNKIATTEFVSDAVSDLSPPNKLIDVTGAQTITISSDYVVSGIVVELASGSSGTVKAGLTVGGEQVLRSKSVYTAPRAYATLIPITGDTVYVTITGQINFYLLSKKFRT